MAETSRDNHLSVEVGERQSRTQNVTAGSTSPPSNRLKLETKDWEISSEEGD